LTDQVKTLERRFRPLFINDTLDPGERHFPRLRKPRGLPRRSTGAKSLPYRR